VLLAILLFGGCAHSGQPARRFPAPRASQPDKPGDDGTDGGGMM
jgi:hypothetical protein